MDTTTTMGARIRAAREDRGWSLADLATRSGLRARLVLQRLETREADAQRAADMASHAAQLGVDVEVYVATLAQGEWLGAAHRQQLQGTAQGLVAVAETLGLSVAEIIGGSRETGEHMADEPHAATSSTRGPSPRT